jgi:predicted regulator of Ras-like GTPase activity (Roadblock/LC7/MglB family)
MALAEDSVIAAAFDGDVSGMTLPDVIQINAQNRVSGCITVQHDGKKGLVFLRDGEIVHAEQGDLEGREAFYAILSWPGGRFSVQRNVSTTCCTIDMGWQHLLMEAARVLDERLAGIRNMGPPASRQRARVANHPGRAVETLRGIPGVVYAVAHGSNGVRLDDDSYEAELLAGQTTYLTMIADQLGRALGAGAISSAMVEGAKQHLLVIAARDHFLGVLVDRKQHVGPIEAAARAAVAPSLG